MAIVFGHKPSFGEGLIKGLGTGLESLAQQKLQQVQQRNLSQKLQEGFGFNPQEAEAFSQLSPDLQKLAFKQKITAPSQQLFAQALGQLQGTGGKQLGLPEGAGLTEKQALDLAKFGQKERQIGTAEAREAREYLAPYEAKYNEARKNIDENNELIALAKSGKLRAGTTQQILDKLGIGTFWQPIENEFAQKTIARMAQNAGAAFNTSRLTNLDVNLYKNSLGTLWNTPTGLEKIAKINKLESKAFKEQHDARRQIIRENKGKIPFDIEAQISDRIEGRLKNLSDKAMNIIAGTSQTKRSAGFDTPTEIAKAGYKPGSRFRLEDGSIGVWNGKQIVPESEYKG